MQTSHDEVADGIHRFATFVPDAGIPFCQFLVDADEPLLFHTGHAPCSRSSATQSPG